MSETNPEKPEPEKAPPSGPKRWRRLGKGIWIMMGLIATICTIAAAGAQWWPRHDLGIAITDPPPGVIMSVGCVFTLSGRGSPPVGQELVISKQQQGSGSNVDPTMYFAVAQITGNTWHSITQVGGYDTPPGTLFAITAWLVNAAWVQYWQQLNPHPKWWGTVDVPPQATKIQSVVVIREGGTC